jgi:hypothetical protein
MISVGCRFGVGTMRKIVWPLIAMAMLTASVPPASVFAQERVAAVPTGDRAPARTINPVVLATLKAFPRGGQTLTDRIRLLVIQNNDLASDVARAIRAKGLLTAAQRAAAEKGLAEALARLGILAQAPGGFSWTDPNWLALIAALAAEGVAFADAVSSHPGPSPLVSPH